MRARLLGHVEQLRVEPVDRAGTLLEDDGDQIAGAVARLPAVELPAQYDETVAGVRRFGQDGAELPLAAVATFLMRDVRAAGWLPDTGDLVTRIDRTAGVTPDERTVALYVVRAYASGKTRYGSELIVCELTNERPTRAQTEGIL